MGTSIVRAFGWVRRAHNRQSSDFLCFGTIVPKHRNLRDNPLNLPMTCPIGKNKDSVQGHYNEVLRYKDALDAAIKKYNEECETKPPVPPSPPRPRPTPPDVDEDDVKRGLTLVTILAAIAAVLKAALEVFGVSGTCSRNGQA